MWFGLRFEHNFVRCILCVCLVEGIPQTADKEEEAAAAAAAADKLAAAVGTAAAVGSAAAACRVVVLCRIAVLDGFVVSDRAVVIADIDPCCMPVPVRVPLGVAASPNLVEFLEVWFCFPEQFANPSEPHSRLG